jgi:hypothetical protein
MNRFTPRNKSWRDCACLPVLNLEGELLGLLTADVSMKLIV